jgi:hypothetical protein
VHGQPAHPLRAVDVAQLLCSLLDVHSALTLAVMGDTLGPAVGLLRDCACQDDELCQLPWCHMEADTVSGRSGSLLTTPANLTAVHRAAAHSACKWGRSGSRLAAII